MLAYLQYIQNDTQKKTTQHIHTEKIAEKNQSFIYKLFYRIGKRR